MSEIKADVYSFINKFFKVEQTELNDDDSLMELGSVYSVGIISMINHIEENYNIIVEDEEINLENFGCVNSIVKYIESHI